MKFFLLSLLSVFFISQSIQAQQWLLDSGIEQSARQYTLDELSTAFNQWAADKDLSQEKGWKQFKRWEYMMQRSMDSTGKFPTARERWMAYKEAEKQNSTLKGNPTWISLNPAVLPPSVDSHQIMCMGRINCITFHPTDTSTFWVGASNGGVWKTTNSGQSWVPLTDNAPTLRISGIAVQQNNPDIMYIATGDIEYINYSTLVSYGNKNHGMGILKSTDGGQTWDTTGLSFRPEDGYSTLLRNVIISQHDTAHLVAAGADGIFKSTDAGATWTKTKSDLFIDIIANPKDNNVLYAATFRSSGVSGSGVRVYKSNDFGSTWTLMNTGIPSNGKRTKLAISHSDTAVVYALTADRPFVSLVKTSNSGTSWELIADKDSIPNLMGYNDGGYTGLMGNDQNGQGTYDLCLAVHPTNPDRIYTGGVNVWSSGDGGKYWEMVSHWTRWFDESIHADQHAFAFHPLSGDFFACNDGGLYKTDTMIPALFPDILACYDSVDNKILRDCYDFPTQWENLSGGLHVSEHYFMGQNTHSADLYAVGSQDNGTRMYKNNQWIFVKGADGGMPMFNYSNPDEMYVATQYGKLYRSDDGGQSFSGNLTGIVPNKPWMPVFRMHPHNPDTLYTCVNGVWASYDRGDSWFNYKITYGIQVGDLQIPEKYPDYTYMVERTKLHISKDAGATWTFASLPVSNYNHRLALNFDNPDKLYISYSGYNDTAKVYMTPDGGATWKNITYNLPNIPANTIVAQYGYKANGDTINGIYVGTDLGVYYTNDSLMNTAEPWIKFGNGLPNVTVLDMHINYINNRLRVATYGRGIWEVDLYESSHGVNVKIEDIKRPAGLNIYPNPTNGTVQLELNNPNEQIYSIEVYDASARKIYSSSNPLHQQSIDLSTQAPGLYFIQVKTDQGFYTSKVIKK